MNQSIENRLSELKSGVVRLNLGCGNRFHKEWLNLDIVATSPEVIAVDLRHGIPLADASCDVVYHCAVLEHLRPEEAHFFIAECRRVLKETGILRVGIPDLEVITRLYLQKLDSARAGDTEAISEREWLCLELFDQLARERSGGEMIKFLSRDPLPSENFILNRIGEEGSEILNAIRGEKPFQRRSLVRRVAGKIKRTLPSLRTLLLSQEDRRALEIGRFRLRGEAHQWMYDDLSLGLLLRECGFITFSRHDAFSSQIPEFSRFNLDVTPEGNVNKPDCFFMEAKPI
jgi:SAM-dependent methyltransferase